jgi:hypothetical protein
MCGLFLNVIWAALSPLVYPKPVEGSRFFPFLFKKTKRAPGRSGCRLQILSHEYNKKSTEPYNGYRAFFMFRL